jgi:hypothetical protein
MNKRYMVFMKKGFMFLLIFLLVEVTLGSAAQYLFFSQSSGKHARITKLIKEAEADLFVFGSSHAARHYVPSVFEEELGLTTHNAGVLGQQLLFHTSLLEMVLERTRPKVIILNIDSYWLFNSPVAYDRITDLSPYYWDYPEILAPKLRLYSEMEPLKLHFKSYQYNSTMVHALKYRLVPQPDDHGYIPLTGEMEPVDMSEVEMVINPKGGQRIDENFVAALDRFIALTRKHQIKLIFVRSPNVLGNWGESASYKLIKEKADQADVPLFDYDKDQRFVANFDLFNDQAHLNDKGAKYFSRLISQDLDSLNRKEKQDVWMVEQRK